MINSLFEINIPIFHHSIIPCVGQKLRPQKIPLFSISCRNSETYNHQSLFLLPDAITVKNLERTLSSEGIVWKLLIPSSTLLCHLILLHRPLYPNIPCQKSFTLLAVCFI